MHLKAGVLYSHPEFCVRGDRGPASSQPDVERSLLVIAFGIMHYPHILLLLSSKKIGITYQNEVYYTKFTCHFRPPHTIVENVIISVFSTGHALDFATCSGYSVIQFEISSHKSQTCMTRSTIHAVIRKRVNHPNFHMLFLP